jgi:iron complex outermembrane receptor protein
MKTKYKPLFLILTAFSAASGASLTGTVGDPKGQPVPGSTITLFSSTGGAVAATTSDKTGTYRFERLSAGRYLLLVEAPGFAPYVAQKIDIGESSADKRDVDLELAGVHEQVLVTASGTPQSSDQVSKAITAIDQADADSRDANSLADAVALAPSVRVRQLGGPGTFTSFQIRGLRTEDTAVLVDGLRLRDASATQADASGLIEDLLLTDANRVEVLRGSGSSLYGTNAIGGVINVITDEVGGRTRGSLLVEGGSLGKFRGRGQVSGGLRNDGVQYSLGVSQINVTEGVGGDAPFRDTSVQGRVTFHLSPSLRLTARLYGADSFSKVMGEPDILGSPSGFGIVNAIALPTRLVRLYENGTPLVQLNTGNATFIPAPDNPDSTRAARFVSGALTLSGQASAKFDYSVSSQLVYNGRRYGDGPAGVGFQPDGSTRSLYDGRIQTVDAQLHCHLGRYHLLSGGYEFENENYANDNSNQSNPAATSAVNVTQRSHTVFAQDQAQFLDGRLQLSAAVRAQFFTLGSPAFQPLMTAPYQGIAFPSPAPAYTGDASAAYFFRQSGTKLRAHVGRGYRAPSLFERFGAGFDPVFGYSLYGDPRLKPEHSIGIDVGFDQTLAHGRLQTSASYFYTWLQNVINFDTSGFIDPATDPFGRFIGYLNRRGGISRGVELSAAAALARSLKVTTSYTYVNALERTPIVGDVLRTFVIPRNQFSILVAEQPTSRLSLTVDMLASSSYLGPIYGKVVTQTYRFGGIHKANPGASYRIPMKEYQAIRIFVRADNILNQTYFENGFLTPGRTTTGGVQFEF